MLNRIVLASASPRRKEMLQSLGLRFEILPADINEQVLPNEKPEAYVSRIAHAKASVIYADNTDSLVIGCDTAVILDQEILGKPVDEKDAARILQQLSGRRHDVISVLVCYSQQLKQSCLVKTKVEFARLSEQDIAQYCATDEPYDKAGAYGIQGGAQRFIRAIEGSYSSVVGLPLCELRQMLAEQGIFCSFLE